MAFLHCFCCGNVAPAAAFSVGRLQCPKCRANLRQIGVDYDRAIESYACAGCSQTFTDPEIVASCLQCAAETDPAGLTARDIRALQLTETGALCARTGLTDVFSPLDSLNYSVPEEFYRQVDWLLKLRRRHDAMVFSLIGVRFANVPELVQSIGYAATSNVVEQVTIRLRDLLRETDMSTRTAEHDLWILLPFTLTDGTAVVKEKMDAIRGQVNLGSNALDLRVAMLPSDQAGEGEDARALISRLAATMDWQ